MGQRIGYVRVSTTEQNHELQLKEMELDKKFVETASGKSAQRPQLELLLEYVRPGDSVYVAAIDRMARNVIDLRNIVSLLAEKKVRIEFLRENLVFTGDDSPTSMFLLNIMGSIAEFERSLMKERQKEGIALAKAKGLYRGGKEKLGPEQILKLQEDARMGIPKTKIAKKFGITRETVYQYLKGKSISPSSSSNSCMT